MGADDAAEAGERSALVREALNDLPKEQRQLIEFAFIPIKFYLICTVGATVFYSCNAQAIDEF